MYIKTIVPSLGLKQFKILDLYMNGIISFIKFQANRERYKHDLLVLKKKNITPFCVFSGNIHQEEMAKYQLRQVEGFPSRLKTIH
jgi:hypothetical protein